MTLDGVLVITAQSYRTQDRNRADALERLIDLIRKAAVPPVKRRATRPSKAAKAERRQDKAKRAGVKSLRGKVRED
jgi:ribosome-associated protein